MFGKVQKMQSPLDKSRLGTWAARGRWAGVVSRTAADLQMGRVRGGTGRHKNDWRVQPCSPARSWNIFATPQAASRHLGVCRPGLLVRGGVRPGRGLGRAQGHLLAAPH